MPEKEPTEEFELSYGEVSKGTRLATLFSHNPNADVRRLDHIDIICTVADCKSSLVLTDTLDEGD